VSHRAGVWLATVSSVVAVATGMFTLRDEVFPEESGTAGAMSEVAYRAGVGEVCDELNDAEEARRRDDRQIARTLPHTRGDEMAQRDLLLDAARRSTARSSHSLERLSGLRAPEGVAAAQRSTIIVWQRNMTRVLGYIERLDRATDRASLMKAVDRLSRSRTVLARDGSRVNAGLRRLGAESCELDPPVVAKAITLPAAPTPKPKPTATAALVTPRTTPVATSAPQAQSAHSFSPRINTPSVQNQSQNAAPRDGG